MIWLLTALGYLAGMGASVYLYIVLDDRKPADTGEGFIGAVLLWPITMPILVTMHLVFRAVARRDERAELKRQEAREVERLLAEPRRELGQDRLKQEIAQMVKVEEVRSGFRDEYDRVNRENKRLLEELAAMKAKL